MDKERIKFLVKANTIEELASKIDILPKALKETVAIYNRGVAAGKDPEFGRTALVGAVGKILSIDTPPFYCYTSRSVLPAIYEV